MVKFSNYKRTAEMTQSIMWKNSQWRNELRYLRIFLFHQRLRINSTDNFILISPHYDIFFTPPFARSFSTYFFSHLPFIVWWRFDSRNIFRTSSRHFDISFWFFLHFLIFLLIYLSGKNAMKDLFTCSLSDEEVLGMVSSCRILFTKIFTPFGYINSV